MVPITMLVSACHTSVPRHSEIVMVFSVRAQVARACGGGDTQPPYTIVYIVGMEQTPGVTLATCGQGIVLGLVRSLRVCHRTELYDCFTY